MQEAKSGNISTSADYPQPALIIDSYRRPAFIVAVAVDRRREAELLFEELYKVRRVGEITLHADLGNRFAGRYEQQARMHQPLADYPPVGRVAELAVELFFERGQAAVGEFRKLLDRTVGEYVIMHDLLETFAEHVAVFEHLILQTAFGVGDDQVDELHHLQVFRHGGVGEHTVPDVVV